MQTYQVPVWFNVQAQTQQHAWEKILRAMVSAERHDQLPPFVVEEPVLDARDVVQELVEKYGTTEV